MGNNNAENENNKNIEITSITTENRNNILQNQNDNNLVGK